MEIGLDTGVCYNPLHNDLDPYAVAYAIATLLEQPVREVQGALLAAGVHGSAEVRDPARRMTDGYTTFAEVYRYILDNALIDRDIRRLKAALTNAPDVAVIRKEDHAAANAGLALSPLV